jgi:hypothetical protein
MKKYLYITLAFFIVNGCTKVNPENLVEYMKLHGSYQLDQYSKVSEYNGEIYACGTFSNEIGKTSVNVQKLDENGNIVWQSPISDSSLNLQATAICTKEFIVSSASKNVGDTNLRIVLTKMDGNGNVIWTNEYGDSIYDTYINDIFIASNGNIIMYGEYTGPDSGGQRAGRVKGVRITVNQNGTYLSSFTFDGESKIIKCLESSTGDLFLIGETDLSNSGQAGRNIFIYHTDENDIEYDYYSHGAITDQTYAGASIYNDNLYIAYSNAQSTDLISVPTSDIRTFESVINFNDGYNYKELAVDEFGYSLVGQEITTNGYKGLYKYISSNNEETTFTTKESPYDILNDVCYYDGNFYSVGSSHTIGNTMALIMKVAAKQN